MLASTRRAMIARLLLVGAAALTSLGAQTSCSASYGDPGTIDDPTRGSGDGPTFTTTLVLKDSAGTVTDRFRRGEIVRFELTVTNRTDAPATVHFSSGAMQDFLVFDADTHRRRWRSTEGQVFIQVLTDLVVPPHETRTFGLDWDQVLASGAMLEPGHYAARGLLPTVGVNPEALVPAELASILVPFTITR